MAYARKENTMEELEEIMDESETGMLPKEAQEMKKYLISEYCITEGTAERYVRILEYMKENRGKLFWYGIADDAPLHGLWKCGAGQKSTDIIPEFLEQTSDSSYDDLLKLFSEKIPFISDIRIRVKGVSGNMLGLN